MSEPTPPRTFTDTFTALLRAFDDLSPEKKSELYAYIGIRPPSSPVEPTTPPTPPRDRWIAVDDPEWPVPENTTIDLWCHRKPRSKGWRVTNARWFEQKFVSPTNYTIDRYLINVTHYRLPPLGPDGEL